jgi:ribulose-5-phosphate 4-epimerase/fuculose-1-phosphate aldolase
MSTRAAIQDNMSEAEWQTRVDLAAAYRLVELYGWSDLLGTHLSARVPGEGNHFLLNPYGLMFDEITASSLVKVDEDGNIISPSDYAINPAGFTIHSAVHMASDDIFCVMHTHTAAGLGVATQKQGLLPLTQQALAVIAQTGYHDFQGIAFDLSERESLVADLADNRVLILRNHGLMTVGRTIAEAFVWLYRAERACKFQLAFQQSGAEPMPIPDHVQEVTLKRNSFAISDEGYRPIGTTEWPALKRKLDRENPGYDI